MEIDRPDDLVYTSKTEARRLALQVAANYGLGEEEALSWIQGCTRVEFFTRLAGLRKAKHATDTDSRR